MGLFDQHMPEEIQEKVVEREVRRREAEMAPSDPINMAIMAAAGWASENWWEPTDSPNPRRRYVEVNRRWIDIVDGFRALAMGYSEGKKAGRRFPVSASYPAKYGEIIVYSDGVAEGYLPGDHPRKPSFRWPPKG